MFTAGELQAMRYQSEAAMRDTFRLVTPGAWVDDGSGGGYPGVGTTTDHPCRKAPIGNGPQERFLAQQIQAVGLEVIVLPVETEIEEGAVGTWIHHETGESKELRVVAVPQRTFLVEKRVIVAPAATVAAVEG